MIKNKRIMIVLAIMMLPAVLLLNCLSTYADGVEFDGTGLEDDGKFHIFMAPPTTMDEKYTLDEIIGDRTHGFGITDGNWGCNDDFSSCRLYSAGLGWTDESYEIIYEFDETVKQKVDAIFENFELPEKGYLMYDTELLKQWVYGGTLVAASHEVRTALQNMNLNVNLEVRTGGGEETLLEDHSNGIFKAYYQGVLYKVIYGMPEAKVVAPHIFYVPTDTPEEEKGDALIDRFAEIYGDDVREIASVLSTDDVAGDLLNGSYFAPELFDDYLEEKVYELNFDFGGFGDSFKIIIVADSEKMNDGFGISSTDLLTDINISTDAVNLPGDVLTYAEIIGDDFGEETEEVKEILGTDLVYGIEIGLYSNAVDDQIGDNGGQEFTVSVPVPESLAGVEKLSAYWIDRETGEPEEHYADITEDGMAVFSTEHFSTYILAESSEDRPDESEEPEEPGEEEPGEEEEPGKSEDAEKPEESEDGKSEESEEESKVPSVPNTGLFNNIGSSLSITMPVFGAVVLTIVGSVAFILRKKED